MNEALPIRETLTDAQRLWSLVVRPRIANGRLLEQAAGLALVLELVLLPRSTSAPEWTAIHALFADIV